MTVPNTVEENIREKLACNYCDHQCYLTLNMKQTDGQPFNVGQVGSIFIECPNCGSAGDVTDDDEMKDFLTKLGYAK